MQTLIELNKQFSFREVKNLNSNWKIKDSQAWVAFSV